MATTRSLCDHPNYGLIATTSTLLNNLSRGVKKVESRSVSRVLS